ncbi:hypothetical protein Q5P01_005947 [Channa striata]|uniref:coagulation factor Xa n=1 Tax=Channa striata TaxID=64152 RepID=A0AA88NHB7_CHASR|nr:hypothetical protein Q5P01_005947 [Channa striata]
MLLRSCCPVLMLLLDVTAAAVFVEKRQANAVLQRWRRANSGFLEELKQGNVERECNEEICSYEEARESFEDDDTTRRFWMTYKHREPCLVNPCLNNGTCVYMGTSYECQCLEGFEGQYCDTGFEDSLKCLYQNGQCQHFCDNSGDKHRCYCADGYKLGEDGRQCVPQVEFPCGRVAPKEKETITDVLDLIGLMGGNHCPKGECPWQVLVQLNGRSHCGGVLIHPQWVITAAHCVSANVSNNLTVVAGEYNLDMKEGTEQNMPVSTVIVHERYTAATGDSDVALLQLNQTVSLNRHVIPVCLPTADFAQRELLLVHYHTLSGWGKSTSGGNLDTPGAPPSGPVSPVLRRMSVPIIQKSQCSQRAQFNFTDNMLCAGYLEGRQESCRGDDGSPLVTLYGSTHFLTGVVGWGQGCPHPGYYRVYTSMANFVDWVRETIKGRSHQAQANEKQPVPPSKDKIEGLPELVRRHRPGDRKQIPSPPSYQQVTGATQTPLLPLSTLSFFQTQTTTAATSGDAMWSHRLSLGLLLLQLGAAHVFLDDKAASQVLMRRKRANSFMEEFKKGNMERECREERCSLEEAREIFEDEQKTRDFWAVYVDGDACESFPCANGGVCKDGIGSYSCYCRTGYQGFNCEIVIPELCENKNGGCEHFCSVFNENVKCSCADGYFLASDDKSCQSNQTFKCGAIITKDVRTVFSLEAKFNSRRASMTRIVNGEDCPPGECPWQALLLNEDHQGFCGGTILNEYIILTAAHCMNQSRYIYVKLGEFDTLVEHGNEATHTVETIITHNKYKPDTYLNDIALIKLSKPIKFSKYMLPACIPEQEFAEKVLMRQPEGIVSGFGRLGEGRQTSTILQRLAMPYVERVNCIESTQLRISTRMFCAGYHSTPKDACQGDSGGPHVTRYRDTYFITGVVSWGEGCARRGKYGVYTQVSKYINWIRSGIEQLMPKKSGKRTKRHRGPIERLYL